MLATLVWMGVGDGAGAEAVLERIELIREDSGTRPLVGTLRVARKAAIHALPAFPARQN